MADPNPVRVRSKPQINPKPSRLLHKPYRALSSSSQSHPLRAAATSALTMLDPNSTMAIDNKKTKKKKSNSKPSDTLENENAKSRKILLRSIAAFLEVNGFNKTLSTLRSEAPIAGDDLNVSSIDIEDLICKFLESSKGHEEAAIDWRKETDLGKVDGSKKDEGDHHGDASKHSHKKKRKHKKEVDDDTNPVAEECGLDDSSNKVKDLEILKSAEDLSIEIKDKKKKKKSQSLSLEENTDKNHLEISCGTAENVDQDNILPDTDVNGKAKKKKKQKKSADGFNKNNESEDHNKIQEIVEEKEGEQNSLTNASSTLHVESNAKHKDEKKRKRKAEATLASLVGNGEKHTEVESESTKEKAAASKNDDTTDAKAHKKRKRSESEEEATHDVNGTKAKGPKHDKLQAHDVQKDQSTCQLAKDDFDGNENEGETRSKSKKRGNHSAEPKTVNAFQRVKIDEVKFADERLQDNSYWALDGTGSGYGAKAQEVLGQVRGRDFRHEKTKKKRGSYRGGHIDLQSHSIKFNYSDEE